ncbi:GNAT family N-acetyltransferase [Jatrophihabitans sp.]|jgi:GNAT superfamily N-acetyltransferase|uniref:GNAT family N-acetyltransferase n=1 Tax=Jatrophihabitans sp. TaxID=1932789 RepID=UPI002EE2F6FD
MEVRPCSEHDLERLRRQWPTVDDVAGSHYGEQHGAAATFLVCWEGDEPLGWALVQWRGCLGENARAAFAQCVEVNHLQVRAEHRGHGAGTAILAAAEQRVRDRGGDQVAVSVEVANTDAARLYQRLGYRPTGVLDVCSYSWFDEQGSRHEEVESSELLLKRL